MNEEQIKAELIVKNPELAKNPAALQAAVQNAMKGQTPANFEGGSAKTNAPSWASNMVNSGANQAQAVIPAKNYRKDEAPTEKAFDMNRFDEFGQKLEDSFNQEDITASGDELRNQLTSQSVAAQQQEKANEKAMRGIETAPTEEANTTTNISETVKEANAEAVPTKGDSPAERKAKNKYKNQSMSIWDAYYNGEFGDPNSDEAKSTRNYFIIDSIAKFASNLGKDIGNIGAQFSGGTIDTNREEAKWNEVRDTLGSEEIQIAKEDLGGPAERRATSELLSNKLTALAANRSATINDLINEVKKEAENATSETVKKSYLALAAMLSGANMNGVSLGATAATGLIEDITKALKGE